MPRILSLDIIKTRIKVIFCNVNLGQVLLPPTGSHVHTLHTVALKHGMSCMQSQFLKKTKVFLRNSKISLIDFFLTDPTNGVLCQKHAHSRTVLSLHCILKSQDISPWSLRGKPRSNDHGDMSRVINSK